MSAIWTFLGNMLLFLVVLTTVICIHELGHFLFARKAGILCHEFSFGMGPRIWSTKRGETIFSIRAFPIGGSVTMAGEEIESEVVKVGDKIRLGFDENHQVNRIVVRADNSKYQDFLEVQVEKIDLRGDTPDGLYINEFVVKPNAHYVFDKVSQQIAPLNRNFNSKSKGQRFMTTFGGPMMNLILAFFVYLLSAFAFGVAITSSTVVGAVSESLPASGVVQAGDKILSVNGVAVEAWYSEDASLRTVNSELSRYQDYDTVVLTVERDGQPLTLPAMTPHFILYSLGFTSTVGSSDLVIGTPLYVKYEVEGETPAEGNALLAHDRIVSINGETMDDWDEIIAYSLSHVSGETLDVLVDRPDVGFVHVVYSPLAADVLDAMGYDPFYARIGISCSTGFSFFGAIRQAAENFGSAAVTIYKTLWLLFTSKQVGLSDMSGFIGIYNATANAASQGIQTLLGWIGLLSVNLGIVNLLPIPALDGGRIAFIAYEAVTKRKPNQKFQNVLNTIMFFLLMGLMVFITYQDILRLFK